MGPHHSTMHDDGDFPASAPPAYAPDDPFPSSHSAVSQLGSSYEQPIRPLCDDEPASMHISGAPYFAMRPPPQSRPRKLLAYTITILPYTRPEEIEPPPMERGMCSFDVDEQDWHSFLNHLFPYNARNLDNTARNEKTQLQQESEVKRCKRLRKIVNEWNEGFFLPRGVSIVLQTDAVPQSLAATPTAKNSELGKALYEVVKNQDVATARLLLTYGADPDYRPTCSTPALTEAVKKGNEEIVQMILERGPDLEARAPCAETALYAAVSKDRLNLLQLLLKYGADVNESQPHGGEPALYLACRKGYTEIVHILLSTNVDLEKTPPGGCTALYKMVEKQNLEMVQLLLSKGAKAETRASGSSSAMFRAAEKGYLDLVRLLLAHGADVNSTSPGGKTALLEIINDKNNLEMVKLLLSYGANINAKAPGGDTPITKASKKGKTDLVKLLLDHSTATSMKG